MRCDEIQERFVELLYDEKGTPSASPELQAHLTSCPSCTRELEELRAVQSALKSWTDEPPPQRVSIDALQMVVPRQTRSYSRWVRYGAIAAMAVMAILAGANSEITWNDDGFALRMQLFSPSEPSVSDYYTKTEVRDLLKTVLNDSEARMMEGNYQMIQRVLDMIEREMDMRLVSVEFDKARGQN